MHKRGLFYVLMGIIASGQTQVDLKTQSRNLDFSGAVSTKPIRVGGILPPTCSVGEFFFFTAAPNGANVYACTAPNTWVVEAGGGTASLVFLTDGVNVGQRNIANFVTGPGLVNVITDTGSRVNIQHSIDTAVVETKVGAQSGSTQLCASLSTSSSVYTCAMTPSLTAYSTGMVVHWKPDVSGAGGTTTLNIDTLGAKPIKLAADGTTDPTAADVQAGQLYSVWYDGTVFRLQSPPVVVGSTATQPACGVALRGRIWQTLGAIGVKDGVAVCAKDAADVYAWRVLY